MKGFESNESNPALLVGGSVGAKKKTVSRASVEDASKKKKLVVLAAVCLAEAHWLEGGTRHRYVYLQNWGRRSTASNDASSSSSKW
jgi:hypothetical protein